MPTRKTKQKYWYKYLAITALEKEIQRIAVDANLFDMGLAVYPYSETCSKKKKKLQEAIQKIKDEIDAAENESE